MYIYVAAARALAVAARLCHACKYSIYSYIYIIFYVHIYVHVCIYMLLL